MKKQIISLVLFVFIALMSNAQYKKASFFTKGGVVYELSGGMAFLPNTFGSKPLQISFSSALEANDKPGNYFFDFGLITKSKVQYNANYSTTSSSSIINGMLNEDRGSLLVSKIGYQYRFFNASQSQKFIPYLRVGFFSGFSFPVESESLRDKDGNDNIIDPDKIVGERNYFYGGHAGAGGTYYITEKFGVRVGLEYNLILGKSKQDYPGYSVVERFQSYPAAIIALRYRIPFE